MLTYDDFVNELVNQHEISAKVVFFEIATKVMDSPDNLAEQFKS